MNPPLLPGLRWALKRSFLEYIGHAPGGRGSLSDGATATELKEILFQPDLAHAPAATQEVIFRAFRGTVVFSAHFGMLSVRISNPRVTITEKQGELTILDPFRQEGDARLLLVTFTIEGHGVLEGFEYWTASDVRLAPEACALFNDVYPANAPFEPLAIVVPVLGSQFDSAAE